MSPSFLSMKLMRLIQIVLHTRETEKIFLVDSTPISTESTQMELHSVPLPTFYLVACSILAASMFV